MRKIKKITIGIMILLSMCGCGKKEAINPEKEIIKEEKKIEGNVTLNEVKIELINSKIENDTSEFLFEITNTSSEAKYLKEIKVIAKDKEGNILISLLGVIEEEIESEEKIEVNCSYGGELREVERFEYELIN